MSQRARLGSEGSATCIQEVYVGVSRWAVFGDSIAPSDRNIMICPALRTSSRGQECFERAKSSVEEGQFPLRHRPFSIRPFCMLPLSRRSNH